MSRCIKISQRQCRGMVNFQRGYGVTSRKTTAASALLLITTTYASALPGSGPCRDRFVWPFSNESVWNMPLGSNATFHDAHIYNVSRDAGCALRSGPAVSLRTVCADWNASWSPATCLSAGCCYSPISPDPHNIPWCHRPGGIAPQWGFHNDADLIVATGLDDPLVPWINQGNWNSGNHCTVTGPQATVIPLPKSFTTPCGGGNNAMALLLPNNCTLIQMQPAFRLDASSPLLALYHEGGPVPFPWNISITGEGATGAHGGSGLSSIGGTIRSGELRPNAPPLAHALKLEYLPTTIISRMVQPHRIARLDGRACYGVRNYGCSFSIGTVEGALCSPRSAFVGQLWDATAMHTTMRAPLSIMEPCQGCSPERCWPFPRSDLSSLRPCRVAASATPLLRSAGKLFSQSRVLITRHPPCVFAATLWTIRRLTAALCAWSQLCLRSLRPTTGSSPTSCRGTTRRRMPSSPTSLPSSR